MPKNNPSDQEVSAIVRGIFEGVSIQAQKKTVQRRIQEHQHKPDIRKLITHYGLDNVCRVSLNLLKRGAFQPALVATNPSTASSQGSLQPNHTPLLVEETTPAPCGGDTSIGERIPSDRLKEHDMKTEGTHQDPSTFYTFSDLRSSIELIQIVGTKAFDGDQDDKFLKADHAMLSLFPLYLEFGLQHSLLTTAQRILEKSLYEFGSRVLAETVQERGWDCAQCVELNDWAKILRTRPELLPKARIEELNKPLQKLLDSIVQIRHTAVHRQKITANVIELFLADAECFTRILDDDTCSRELANIRQEVSGLVQGLAQQQKSTQERLLEIASNRKSQQTKLQLLEHEAVAQVLHEAQEHKCIMASSFQQATSLNTSLWDATPVAVSCGDDCSDHSNQLSLRLCATCVDHLRGAEPKDVGT